jgi:Acetyltransferases, including N-acetylases of ribosomal proteins
MPSNTASISVLGKLGFVCEGESKKYLKINGKWENHYHYVLINETVE